jgi:hypothetical protein
MLNLGQAIPFPIAFGPGGAGRAGADATRGALRRVRLNLPSSHVPLFHAWRP